MWLHKSSFTNQYLSGTTKAQYVELTDYQQVYMQRPDRKEPTCNQIGWTLTQFKELDLLELNQKPN